MEPYEEHIALATAVAVGLLIGLEREQSDDSGTGRFAGIRTYPIFALIGGLATMLEPTSMWIPLAALVGVIALLAISYAYDLKNGRDHGVTTEASVIATYLLGALATSRGAIQPMSTRLVLVAMLGVTLTFLLSSKKWFHSFARNVSREELYSTVQFLIVAVIVLPLLPHRDLGPLGAIDPFNVGLMVVTIAGLSFLGYIAIRLLGARRGLLVGAALGGLVSSTAVTVSFSTRAKQDPKLAPVAAAAIAVASSIMMIRVAILVALVDAALFHALAAPLGAMIAMSIAIALVTYRTASKTVAPEVAVANPFALGSAIRFGVLFAIILLASKAAVVYIGDRGLYIANGLAGLTDVDAVTLSTAKLANDGLAAQVATVAILIAIGANTIVKLGIATVMGPRALVRRVATIVGLVVAAGAIGLAAGWSLI